MINNLRNDYLTALLSYILCAVPLTYIYSHSTYYAGHLEYVTPHHVAVALNLEQNYFLLCEDIIDEVCQSYHRHPPLHFYVINLVTGFFSLPEYKILATRIYSVLVSTLYVPLFYFFLKKRFNWSNSLSALIACCFYLSTRHIVLYAGIGSFDCYTLPVVMLVLLSLHERNRVGLAIALILSFLVSWYLYLLGLVVSIIYRKALYEMHLQSLIVISALVAPIFVVQGINFEIDASAAAENIIGEARELSTNDIILNILNIAKNLIPLAIVGLIPFTSLLKFGELRKRIMQSGPILLIPVVTILLWMIIFFMWSVYHNFVFLLLVPTIHIIASDFVELINTQDKWQKMFVLLVTSAMFFVQSTSILDKSYDEIKQQNNGQYLFERAIK